MSLTGTVTLSVIGEAVEVQGALSEATTGSVPTPDDGHSPGLYHTFFEYFARDAA